MMNMYIGRIKKRKARNTVMFLLAEAIMFLIVTGCSSEAEPAIHGDERKAADAIKAKGYKIFSTLGESEVYILDREKLIEAPYMNIWSVQEADPEQYFGKSIASYDFVVSGHPLEQMYASTNQSSKYEFHINVMLSEGEVIGGYAYPVGIDGALSMGGAYSIDGKSQEEMTGLSYSEWLAQWKKKYSQ